MAEALFWFRSLHIFFAILWAGAGFYRMAVVERLLRSEAEVRDRYYAHAPHGPYMGIGSLGTVVFGSITLVLGTGSHAYDMDALGGGFFLFHGALGLAMLALVVGLAGHMPTDIRLRRIAQARLAGGDAPEARYAVLQRRDALLGRISMSLIGFAALGMTFFRAFA